MGGDAVKYIVGIFKWINLTQLSNGDEAADDSSSFGTGISSCEEQFFASNGDDSRIIFGKIVVNIEFIIFCILIQCLPLSKRVTYRLAQGMERGYCPERDARVA
jgi:hypothetical protein